MGLTLEDRSEIEELLYRYAYAMDKGRDNPDTRSEDIFTNDAVIETPIAGKLTGPNVLDKLRYRADRPDMLTRHAMTNVMIKGDGNRATVTAYLLEFITWLTPKFPHSIPTTEFAFAGHYDCMVTKADGKWLIERRVVHLDSRPE